MVEFETNTDGIFLPSFLHVETKEEEWKKEEEIEEGEREKRKKERIS